MKWWSHSTDRNLGQQVQRSNGNSYRIQMSWGHGEFGGGLRAPKPEDSLTKWSWKFGRTAWGQQRRISKFLPEDSIQERQQTRSTPVLAFWQKWWMYRRFHRPQDCEYRVTSYIDNKHSSRLSRPHSPVQVNNDVFITSTYSVYLRVICSIRRLTIAYSITKSLVSFVDKWFLNISMFPALSIIYFVSISVLPKMTHNFMMACCVKTHFKKSFSKVR